MDAKEIARQAAKRLFPRIFCLRIGGRIEWYIAVQDLDGGDGSHLLTGDDCRVEARETLRFMRELGADNIYAAILQDRKVRK